MPLKNCCRAARSGQRGSSCGGNNTSEPAHSTAYTKCTLPVPSKAGADIPWGVQQPRERGGSSIPPLPIARCYRAFPFTTQGTKAVPAGKHEIRSPDHRGCHHRDGAARFCRQDGVGMVFPRLSPPAPCWQGPTGPGASSTQPRERFGAKGAPGECGELWSHPVGALGPNSSLFQMGKISFFPPSLCLNYRASSGNPLSNRRAVSPSLRITGLKPEAAHGGHPPASSHRCIPQKTSRGSPRGRGVPGGGGGDAAHSWRAGYIWSGFQRRSRPCSTPAGP